jgi:hypothetical protein
VAGELAALRASLNAEKDRADAMAEALKQSKLAQFELSTAHGRLVNSLRTLSVAHSHALAQSQSLLGALHGPDAEADGGAAATSTGPTATGSHGAGSRSALALAPPPADSLSPFDPVGGPSVAAGQDSAATAAVISPLSAAGSALPPEAESIRSSLAVLQRRLAEVERELSEARRKRALAKRELLKSVSDLEAERRARASEQTTAKLHAARLRDRIAHLEAIVGVPPGAGINGPDALSASAVGMSRGDSGDGGADDSALMSSGADDGPIGRGDGSGDLVGGGALGGGEDFTTQSMAALDSAITSAQERVDRIVAAVQAVQTAHRGTSRPSPTFAAAAAAAALGRALPAAPALPPPASPAPSTIPGSPSVDEKSRAGNVDRSAADGPAVAVPRSLGTHRRSWCVVLCCAVLADLDLHNGASPAPSTSMMAAAAAAASPASSASASASVWEGLSEPVRELHDLSSDLQRVTVTVADVRNHQMQLATYLRLSASSAALRRLAAPTFSGWLFHAVGGCCPLWLQPNTSTGSSSSSSAATTASLARSPYVSVGGGVGGGGGGGGGRRGGGGGGGHHANAHASAAARPAAVELGIGHGVDVKSTAPMAAVDIGSVSAAGPADSSAVVDGAVGDADGGLLGELEGRTHSGSGDHAYSKVPTS